jgi:hypothetical protein
MSALIELTTKAPTPVSTASLAAFLTWKQFDLLLLMPRSPRRAPWRMGWTRFRNTTRATAGPSTSPSPGNRPTPAYGRWSGAL